MKTYTPKQLKQILDRHSAWLADSTKGERANLSSADLGYAYLRSADLRSADLRYANLSSANLRSANLSSADLGYANLSSANLRYANLSSANLSSANLSYADLGSADLRYADLGSANLGYANLGYADLGSADLRYANLSSANLGYANLGYADLRSADLRYANLSSANLPAPTIVLLASWGTVSQNLCKELMRYDAYNTPNGKKLFAAWVKTGDCPYSNLRIQRCANFDEDATKWSYGPAKSAYELMVMVIREKCSDSDYHRKTGKD